ncbi:hypothetical protein C3495_08415 [Clostridiaceae bacterium 14S0207]|nr:hypothetical protein C3495_08415 [Clostridiaceae bacterium 14S0207]
MVKVYIEKNENYTRILKLDQEKNITLCLMEKEDFSPKIGHIYLGAIENIAPRINGYFVNIGTNKNCFMNKEKAHKNLKIGEYVLVEILKEEIGEKGAVVTSKISLGANYIVLSRGTGKVICSKKIVNKEFKSNVKNLFEVGNLDIIFKGKSENVSEEEIKKEFTRLHNKFSEILKKESFSTKVGEVYNSHGILKECIYTIDANESYEFIINDKTIKEYVDEYIDNINEEQRKNFKVTFIEESFLIEKFHLEEKILDLRNKKVFLNSGGNMVIDRMEALTVIDINSGSNKIECPNIKEENINLQCAEKIPSLIMSRNLSGIIIIDFINIKSKRHKEEVIKVLKKGFYKDRNKVTIKDFNELNLVHIVRERRGKNIYEYLDESIDNNFININRVSLDYFKFYVRNKIKNLSLEHNMKLKVTIPMFYKNDVEKDKNKFLKEINLKNYLLDIDFKENLDKIVIEKILF